MESHKKENNSDIGGAVVVIGVILIPVTIVGLIGYGLYKLFSA